MPSEIFLSEKDAKDPRYEAMMTDMSKAFESAKQQGITEEEVRLQWQDNYAFALSAYSMLTGKEFTPWQQAILDRPPVKLELPKGSEISPDEVAKMYKEMTFKPLQRLNRDTAGKGWAEKVQNELKEFGKMGDMIFNMFSPDPTQRPSVTDFTKTFPEGKGGGEGIPPPASAQV